MMATSTWPRPAMTRATQRWASSVRSKSCAMLPATAAPSSASRLASLAAFLPTRNRRSPRAAYTRATSLAMVEVAPNSATCRGMSGARDGPQLDAQEVGDLLRLRPGDVGQPLLDHGASPRVRLAL